MRTCQYKSNHNIDTPCLYKRIVISGPERIYAYIMFSVSTKRIAIYTLRSATMECINFIDRYLCLYIDLDIDNFIS